MTKSELQERKVHEGISHTDREMSSQTSDLHSCFRETTVNLSSLLSQTNHRNVEKQKWNFHWIVLQIHCTIAQSPKELQNLISSLEIIHILYKMIVQFTVVIVWYFTASNTEAVIWYNSKLPYFETMEVQAHCLYNKLQIF